MKKSRYTDSQIVAILKQAEAGTPVPELCREHGNGMGQEFDPGRLFECSSTSSSNEIAEIIIVETTNPTR